VQGRTGEAAEADAERLRVAEEMQASNRESSVDDGGALLRVGEREPALGDWKALAGDRRSK
jgi:hypothetical protein